MVVPHRHRRRVILLLATCLSSIPTVDGGDRIDGGDISTNNDMEVPSALGEYVPMMHKVHQKDTQCIYDLLAKGDRVTYSAYLVESDNGGPMHMDMKFEGPIIGDVEGGMKNGGHVGRAIRDGYVDNWPNIKRNDVGVRYDKRMGIIDHSMRIDWTHAGEEEDAVAMRERIEVEKREAYRNGNYGHPRSSSSGVGGGERPGEGSEGEMIDDDRALYRTIVMSKVEPYEVTNVIKAQGWYRLCVTADHHALYVRLEIRSGLKLGGLDSNTGKVYTYVERDRLNAEMALDEELSRHEMERKRSDRGVDTNTYATIEEERRKVIENQVKEMDLHPTKAMMGHLSSMVGEIRRRQDHHQDMMRNHKATTRRNFDSLVRSGTLETLLYVLLTFVQLYTVRSWLLSKSLLGSFQSHAQIDPMN